MTDDDVIAIIPARGGSKGIPSKNIRPLAGKPLLAYSIEHARQAASVDRVLVSTDGPEIAAVAEQYGAQVIWRPAEISGDTASSESALIHALDQLRDTEHCEPELVVFLQCTSPIRRPDDVENAVQTLRAAAADSLLSVVSSHRFLWRREAGEGRSVNYDFRQRPRRQDRAPEFAENGSIYVFKPWVLRDLGNRLGGKVGLYEMDYWSGFEIDDPEDFALCEWIIERQRRERARAQLPQDVALVVFDFDGVFTDNRVVVFQNGDEAVLCDRGDGMGIGLLKSAGVDIVVLSTEKNPVVAARCRKLGIECVQDLADKQAALMRVLAERQIDPARVVFVGNDVNDLECMRVVGHAVAPADAHPQVRAAVATVLASPGGRGAIRELCDLLLAQRRTHE